MMFFSPRPLRLESEYRIGIRLQESKSGVFMPGLRSCVMVNISRGGVCLVLSQMLLERKHLFFSALDSDQYNLVLLIDNPESSEQSFAIPARSVWMDSCHYENAPAFKIGLCFFEQQKELFQLFKK